MTVYSAHAGHPFRPCRPRWPGGEQEERKIPQGGRHGNPKWVTDHPVLSLCDTVRAVRKGLGVGVFVHQRRASLRRQRTNRGSFICLKASSSFAWLRYAAMICWSVQGD